ncbi:hypothetical protein DY000_02002234 [Brassica cretica]|nr:hypothetical protein DY000_02002234 [Brassica cretica]
MAPDACAAAPRAPHVRLHVQDTCRTPPLLPHVRMHAWSACKKPHQYTHVDQHASVACAETPRAWSIHLVLLHVRLHVLLPCTLVYRTIHSLAVVIWRVNHLSVRYLYMGFRFNGCKRSRRIGLEAAISETLRRTTTSSLGDSLSCRRKYGCRVIWVCFCLDSYWSSLGIVVGSCRSRCFKV